MPLMSYSTVARRGRGGGYNACSIVFYGEWLSLCSLRSAQTAFVSSALFIALSDGAPRAIAGIITVSIGLSVLCMIGVRQTQKAEL